MRQGSKPEILALVEVIADCVAKHQASTAGVRQSRMAKELNYPVRKRGKFGLAGIIHVIA